MEKRIGAKSGGGGGKALKDLLSKVVSEYNKLVTVKKHRIDTHKRALCYNMRLSHNLMRLTLFLLKKLHLKFVMPTFSDRFCQGSGHPMSSMTSSMPTTINTVTKPQAGHREVANTQSNVLVMIKLDLISFLYRSAAGYSSNGSLGTWKCIPSRSSKVSEQACVQGNPHYNEQNMHCVRQACH